jgi:uncharacterized repeat protein (TIGR01451 family)
LTPIPPELGIAKDVSPASASVGEVVQFTIYVWNNGPGVAQNVVLTDTLGSCFQFVDPDPSRSLGDMAQGSAYVISFDARVINNSACSAINTASISSDNGICSPVSCSDSAQVSIPGGGGPAIINNMGASSLGSAPGTNDQQPSSSTTMLSTTTSTVTPTSIMPTATWTQALTASSTQPLEISGEPLQATPTTTPNPTSTPSLIGAAPRAVSGSPAALALPLTLLFLPILMSMPGMDQFLQWAHSRSRP